MTRKKIEPKLGDLVKAHGEKGYFRVLGVEEVESPTYLMARDRVAVRVDRKGNILPDQNSRVYKENMLFLKKVLSQQLKPSNGGHAYTVRAYPDNCVVITDDYLMKKEKEFATALDNLVKALEVDL